MTKGKLYGMDSEGLAASVVNQLVHESRGVVQGFFGDWWHDGNVIKQWADDILRDSENEGEQWSKAKGEWEFSYDSCGTFLLSRRYGVFPETYRKYKRLLTIEYERSEFWRKGDPPVQNCTWKVSLSEPKEKNNE